MSVEWRRIYQFEISGLSIGIKRAAIGITLLFWLLVLVQWLGHSLPVVRPVIGFVFLTIVPGALFLTWSGIEPRVTGRWLVYVVGFSLILLMGLGLGTHLILSFLGHPSPFSLVSFSVGVTLLIALLLYALRETDRKTLEFDTRLDIPTIFFLQLPLWAVLSVNHINVTGKNPPIIVVLGLLSLIPVFVAIGLFPRRRLALGVWTIAIAILLHKSLWRMHVYRGHSSAITIWNTGLWHPASENLLSLAVLPPMYAFLLDVSILTQLKVVHPFLVAFIPLGMFVMFQSYVGPVKGFLGASLFVFAHPFFFQYPAEPRVGLPVLFLVLLGVIMSDTELSQVQKRTLSMAFGTGIIVSHYGTSYYVMFALIGAAALLYLIYPALDECVALVRGEWPRRTIWAALLERASRARNQSLHWSFGGLYLVTTITWYLYTKQARTFESLIFHIFNALQSLLGTTSSLGSTATRLQTNYGGISIALSKYLYMIFGLLIALGFAISYFRRFVHPRVATFDDEFLALATLLFVLFGGSLVFSGEWGGGRPMMIVFSFASVYVVIGAANVSLLVRRAAVAVTDLVNRDLMVGLPSRSNIPLGALLAIFLLLNAGVVATAVPGGRAPSNVPLQADFSESDNPNLQTLLFVSTDTELHAWLASHMTSDYEIYGDRLARAQATDWYVGRIFARTGPVEASYRFQKSNHLPNIDGGEVEKGYLILMGHNIVYGTLAIDYISWGQLASLDLELEDRSRIYSNGQGMIYFHGNETRSRGLGQT